MNKISNLALIVQMIEAAEKNIQSAKQLLREGVAGGSSGVMRQSMAMPVEKLNAMSVSEGGKVIEGIFDGQNMSGPDNKQYPVPANYASKSKLIEGDVLKLTIADDGSFIYKQIGPAERRKVLGILTQDEKGDYRVMAEGKIFKVLLASLTYFKAESGDEVTIIVPKDHESQWAAVENVIKRGAGHADMELGSEASGPVDYDQEMDMDGQDAMEPAQNNRVIADEDEEF